jgi:antitoxin Phd
MNKIDANNLYCMTVKTFPSREVQAHFGAVLDEAKRGSVTVTQYGRPVVVMMGYEEAMSARRALATQRMLSFMESRPNNPAADALTDEDINRLVHELRP